MPYGGGRNNAEYRCFEIIAQRFQQKHVNYNLVFFRDEIEIFIISLFETRSRFVPSISRASRRDRDLYLLYLVLRDEIENLLYQILNFEKGTRNKKGFLVIEREFSSLILTRFFEIENSRQCLLCGTFYLSGSVFCVWSGVVETISLGEDGPVFDFARDPDKKNLTSIKQRWVL